MAVEASVEEFESQWGRLIVAEDVEAAFGRPARRPEKLEFADEALRQFTLEGTPKAWVMVVLKDHQFLGGGLDPQNWWPVDDLGEAVGGVGDKAFLTLSGGLVARSGDRWTAGVRADVQGAGAPDFDQQKDLLRRVLRRTETDADPYYTASTLTDREPVSILITKPFRAGPRHYLRAKRRKQAGFILAFLLLTLFCGAISNGLYGESGGPALFGKTGRARVTGACTGLRAPMCPVVLVDQGRETGIRADYFPATLEPDKGDVVKVRYRNGKAIPDNILAMIGSLLLVAAFALFAVLSFGVAVALLEIWHSRLVARIATRVAIVAAGFAMAGAITRYAGPILS